MGGDFHTNYREETLISRLESSRQSAWGRQLHQLSDCADQLAQRLAESNGVDIRVYDIIYRLTEDIEKALKGLLEPVFEDVVIGHAEVRAVFRIPKVGAVAGSMISDGTAARNARARLKRGDKVIYDGKVASLKRFTEDVREVAAGHECGVGLEGFDAFEVGDVIEFYRKERAS